MSYYYIRAENCWLSKNDSSLLEDIQNNLTFEEIAIKYNKPIHVVRSRVLHLALHMINELGFGIKTVSNITSISQNDLQTYIELIERKKNNLFSKL